MHDAFAQLLNDPLNSTAFDDYNWMYVKGTH